MMLADRRKPIRPGVTLVELLIVVSIMTLLAAIALPSMQTGMEARRTREATRAIHVYFGSARVRAIENGRPVGVMIERSDENPEAGVLLRQVEIPPPYAGDFDGTTLVLQDWTAVPNQDPSISDPDFYMRGYHVVKAFIAPGNLSDGIVKRGNRVRLGYKGPSYIIVEDPYERPDVDYPVDADEYILFSTVGCVLTLRAANDQVNAVPWIDVVPSGSWPPSVDFSDPALWSGETPFQITRNPVSSSVAPLSLPRGMVVDLGDSGNDMGVFPETTQVATGPLIMFSPDGQIESIWANGVSELASLPIYLMIGRRERVGQPVSLPPSLTVPPLLAEDGLENWQDADNLWLALTPQSGQVTVAEVSAELPPGNLNNPTANVYVPLNILTSRALVRQAQVSMGGR